MYDVELLTEAKRRREEAIGHRRTLHALAETGFQLPKTMEYVKNYLQSQGVSPRSYGYCGVSADIRCLKEDAPFLLLRADADALPIKEESELPFASQNGNMHACGHDMHTAMLLSAVPLLLSRREALPCHVRLMFQGAEEILGGAYRMLAEGVAQSVCAAYMIHVMTACPFSTGTVLLPPAGEAAPAAAFFRIDIMGEGGHGALTHQGRDALHTAVMSAATLLSLQTSARFTLGTLESGRAANVLPTSATLCGTVRAMSEEAVEETVAQLSAATKSIARIYGGSADLTVTAKCPPLRINSALRESSQAFLARLLGAENVISTDSPSGASEDFAFIAARCPALTVALAAGKREEGYAFPLHHPRARFDEEALPYGAAVYTSLALSHRL